MKKVFLLLAITAILIPTSLNPAPATSARRDKVILWSRNLGEVFPNNFGAPVVDSDRVYLANSSKVVCFSMDSGELLWQGRFDESGNGLALQANIGLHKDYVFFTNTGGLYCLDKPTGKTVWQRNAYFTSNAEFSLGCAYVASNNTIYQLEAETGKVIKQIEFLDKESYRFLTSAGKNRLIASTYLGTRKMVDMASGKVVWENDGILTNIREKPVVQGKNLIISGLVFGINRLLISDLETGELVGQSLNPKGTQFDLSDGRILLSDRCLDSGTLLPIWHSVHGNFRAFDCFDVVCFWESDNYKILDWNGNEIATKNPSFLSGTIGLTDQCGTKPATSNGRYFIVTERGYLVCYGNRPEYISYTLGDKFISANGKKIMLQNEPFENDKGELFVDPVGFLEPLGWVSFKKWNKYENSVHMHDYERQIELYYSGKSRRHSQKYKQIPCLANEDGTIVMPLEQMVSVFGLAMTRDGDRIKLSYQSK